MAKTAPLSWSDIPLELAGLVLCCLPAHVDRVRFTAVCPQWRIAAKEVSLPPPLPLLAFPDGTVYSLPGSEPFRIPACAGYTEACGNWLVFSHEDECFLRDPFSNATVTLPALSRIRVRYVGDKLSSASMKRQNAKHLTVSDVLFCSPNLIAARVLFQESYRIAVCQPDATSWWSVHVDDRSRPVFGDIAFNQGKLYVLDHRNGDLFSVDISIDCSSGDPWVSRLQHVINGINYNVFGATPDYAVLQSLYLVELRGSLLMVLRTAYRRFKTTISFDLVPNTWKNEFEVFKADFEQSLWAKVTTIGDDLVLFLREQCCRSVCISQYKMPGDRIFFMENGDGDEDGLGNGDWDYEQYFEERLGPCRVFDLRDGKVSALLPSVPWNRSTKLATWLFPQEQE